MRAGTAGLVAATFGVVAFCAALECGVSVPFVAAGDETSDVDALIAKLVGGDAKASAAASDTLVAMGAAAVPRLTAALADNPVPTRVAVLATFGRIAADHDEALPPLVASLADKTPAVRVAAAHALFVAGPRAKAATSQLKAALADNFVEVRVDAAAALIRAGDPAGPMLQIVASALTNPDVAVRIAAIRVLGVVGVKDDALAAAVGRCARSADASERTAALAAIPKLTDQPVADVIDLGGPFRGDRVKRAKAKQLGATPKVHEAVASALDWLARHQSKDGSWSAVHYDDQCKLNRCDGPGAEEVTTGVTALALLAFLGAGETHTYGPHKDVVARGLAYLRGVQGADGRVGKGGGKIEYVHWTKYSANVGPFMGGMSKTESEPVDGGMYGHAVATVALVEAFMLSGDVDVGGAAKKAVGYVLAARNPDAGWHYACPPNGTTDTSVTGWMCWALATARAAGIDVDKRAFDDAVAWIDKKTEPEFGRTGYRQIGGPPSRIEGADFKFPGDKVESTTSIAVAVRLFAGRRPKDDQNIGKGIELILKKVPKWDVEAGTLDFYYWFWGATALRQLAGANWKTDLWGAKQGATVWKTWSTAMNAALLASQRAETDRDERGSWDAVDAWSSVGGRVYATAMCCMTLESYWRMDSLLDAK